MSDLSNAVHEAGHAVIARVLNLRCGQVSLVQDDDSAGHSVTFDEWQIIHEWECQGRLRCLDTAHRARIIAYMAGAEAERVILGECAGGDGDDRYWIDLMLEQVTGKLGDIRLESRLRSWTRTLCKRHESKIRVLADALMGAPILTDDQVRALLQMANQPFVQNGENGFRQP